jgi:hypothetical protein
MTERNEVGAGTTAQERLREKLLTSALYDWIPMIEVRTKINYYGLAEALAAQQDLALRTIRSLLEDGLIMVGDLPNTGEKLKGWDLSIDEVMTQLEDRFVRSYDDPVAWEFSIWLGLTAAGERVGKELEGKKDGRA